MSQSLKKILFVASVYKPNIGGIETVIDGMGSFWSKRGVYSAVLTKRHPAELPDIEKTQHETIFRVDRPRHPDEYIRCMDTLLQNEALLKADIVHVVGVRRPLPLFALLLARRWGAPCIASFAGADVPSGEDDEANEVWREGLGIVPESIMQFDAWHAFSRPLCSAARALMPGLGEAEIIYGNIDTETIRSSQAYMPDKPYILSVRRLVYSKGIDLLVRAFGEISGRIPHDLILVGDGPERQNLEGLVSGLGLRQRVRFTGSLPFEAVCSYIKGADVHVCPSRSEGGGLVNIIAAAAGCPAIGSDVEGIPEYVMNEETGLLFRAGDIRDLEDKMLDLLLDDGKREKMKETGRVFGEKFATPRIMDQYLALYERARGRVRSSFLPWSPLTDRLYQRIMTR